MIKDELTMTKQADEILTRRLPNWDTVQDAIFLATNQLASTTPRLDAELLLAQVMKVSRGYCYSHPEQSLTLEQQLHFQALIQQRLAGEPIAYLIGKQAFWNHEFLVTPATLIPRPETELLVQLLLDELPTESELQIERARALLL
jgi:release factor glutamine methyltransferase